MSTPSTSENTVLQIADTRFAITCSYPPFETWLRRRCQGFISQGEPHLRLHITLDRAPQGQNSKDFLTVVANGDHNKQGELELTIACPHLAYLFGITLQICLRCAIAAKHPADFLLHSAGIVHEGTAYLFLGPSGAGKSTVCRILSREDSFTILHDEIVAITQTEEGFQARSTFLSGEMPSSCSRSARLKAVFFLKQDRTNYVTRLSGREAAGQLARGVVPPYIAKDGRLGYAPQESLRSALALAERIPCYELHFRPERAFWDCIPPLFEKESALATG